MDMKEMSMTSWAGALLRIQWRLNEVAKVRYTPDPDQAIWDLPPAPNKTCECLSIVRTGPRALFALRRNAVASRVK